MRRGLFNVVCAVSLIGLIVVLVLWMRSYWRADYVAYCGENVEFGVISSVGRIIVYDEAAIAPFSWKPPFGWRYDGRPAPRSIEAYALPNASREVSWMGFGVMSGDNGRYRASARFVPHWAVGVVAVILPSVWIRRWVRERSGERGFEVGILD